MDLSRLLQTDKNLCIMEPYIDICNLYLFFVVILDKNSPQTDEEKQRERQRNEREQKNAELEAHNIKVNSISM